MTGGAVLARARLLVAGTFLAAVAREFRQIPVDHDGDVQFQKKNRRNIYRCSVNLLNLSCNTHMSKERFRNVFQTSCLQDHFKHLQMF